MSASSGAALPAIPEPWVVRCEPKRQFGGAWLLLFTEENEHQQTKNMTSAATVCDVVEYCQRTFKAPSVQQALHLFMGGYTFELREGRIPDLPLGSFLKIEQGVVPGSVLDQLRNPKRQRVSSRLEKAREDEETASMACADAEAEALQAAQLVAEMERRRSDPGVDAEAEALQALQLVEELERICSRSDPSA